MQSLLDQMVDLFDPIEELVEFYEAANNPIPVGEVVNISYLLILRTGGMVKACGNWEDIMVVQKNWHTFKDHFEKSYKRYQICKKQQPLPIDMALQKTMHMKQTPRWWLWIHYKPL